MEIFWSWEESTFLERSSLLTMSGNAVLRCYPCLLRSVVRSTSNAITGPWTQLLPNGHTQFPGRDAANLVVITVNCVQTAFLMFGSSSLTASLSDVYSTTDGGMLVQLFQSRRNRSLVVASSDVDSDKSREWASSTLRRCSRFVEQQNFRNWRSLPEEWSR